jgi:threonine dehydrogenase-like Zn-dependent dehydrogenase
MDWLNAKAPLIFGDEIIGRVVRIGDEASRKRGLSIGDRVAVESRWPCNGCSPCLKGQYYLCETRGGITEGYGTIGLNEAPGLWGGYSTHVYVPGEVLAYRIQDSLTDEGALIACSPFANGLRWFGLTEAGSGDHVVVFGPGTQGLMCALAGVLAGAHVTLVGLETDRARLATAKAIGISDCVSIRPEDTEESILERIAGLHGPAHAVIEASGAASAKRLALSLLKPLGIWVNVSVPSNKLQEIDWLGLMLKEITIKSPLSHPHGVEEALEKAVKLKESGLDLGKLVTHIYPLDEVETALSAASYQLEGVRPVKVAIKPNDKQ